jgi:hypothetical protein
LTQKLQICQDDDKTATHYLEGYQHLFLITFSGQGVQQRGRRRSIVIVVIQQQ